MEKPFITEAPAQRRMQLLQQLLTLISCCCVKLRRKTRAKLDEALRICRKAVKVRIKHQLFEVGIQLENPEMSSDLETESFQ